MNAIEFQVLKDKLACVEVHAIIQKRGGMSACALYHALINGKKQKSFNNLIEARMYISRCYAHLVTNGLADICAGNYIANDGRVLKVSSDMIPSIHSGTHTAYPIGLAENPKVRYCIGFSKPSWNLGIGEDSSILTIKDRDIQFSWKHDGLYLFTGSELIGLQHIKYVHQLQNIYKLIIGTELVITPRIDSISIKNKKK